MSIFQEYLDTGKYYDDPLTQRSTSDLLRRERMGEIDPLDRGLGYEFKKGMESRTRGMLDGVVATAGSVLGSESLQEAADVNEAEALGRQHLRPGRGYANKAAYMVGQGIPELVTMLGSQAIGAGIFGKVAKLKNAGALAGGLGKAAKATAQQAVGGAVTSGRGAGLFGKIFLESYGQHQRQLSSDGASPEDAHMGAAARVLGTYLFEKIWGAERIFGGGIDKLVRRRLGAEMLKSAGSQGADVAQSAARWVFWPKKYGGSIMQSIVEESFLEEPSDHLMRMLTDHLIIGRSDAKLSDIPGIINDTMWATLPTALVMGAVSATAQTKMNNTLNDITSDLSDEKQARLVNEFSPDSLAMFAERAGQLQTYLSQKMSPESVRAAVSIIETISKNLALRTGNDPNAYLERFRVAFAENVDPSKLEGKSTDQIMEIIREAMPDFDSEIAEITEQQDVEQITNENEARTRTITETVTTEFSDDQQETATKIEKAWNGSSELRQDSEPVVIDGHELGPALYAALFAHGSLMNVQINGAFFDIHTEGKMPVNAAGVALDIEQGKILIVPATGQTTEEAQQAIVEAEAQQQAQPDEQQATEQQARDEESAQRTVRAEELADRIAQLKERRRLIAKDRQLREQLNISPESDMYSEQQRAEAKQQLSEVREQMRAQADDIRSLKESDMDEQLRPLNEEQRELSYQEQLAGRRIAQTIEQESTESYAQRLRRIRLLRAESSAHRGRVAFEHSRARARWSVNTEAERRMDAVAEADEQRQLDDEAEQAKQGELDEFAKQKAREKLIRTLQATEQNLDAQREQEVAGEWVTLADLESDEEIIREKGRIRRNVEEQARDETPIVSETLEDSPEKTQAIEDENEIRLKADQARRISQRAQERDAEQTESLSKEVDAVLAAINLQFSEEDDAEEVLRLVQVADELAAQDIFRRRAREDKLVGELQADILQYLQTVLERESAQRREGEFGRAKMSREAIQNLMEFISKNEKLDSLSTERRAEIEAALRGFRDQLRLDGFKANAINEFMKGKLWPEGESRERVDKWLQSEEFAEQFVQYEQGYYNREKSIKMRTLNAMGRANESLSKEEQARIDHGMPLYSQDEVNQIHAAYLPDRHLAIFFATATPDDVLHEWVHHIVTEGLLPLQHITTLNNVYRDQEELVDGFMRYIQRGEMPSNADQYHAEAFKKMKQILAVSTRASEGMLNEATTEVFNEWFGEPTAEETTLLAAEAVMESTALAAGVQTQTPKAFFSEKHLGWQNKILAQMRTQIDNLQKAGQPVTYLQEIYDKVRWSIDEQDAQEDIIGMLSQSAERGGFGWDEQQTRSMFKSVPYQLAFFSSDGRFGEGNLMGNSFDDGMAALEERARAERVNKEDRVEVVPDIFGSGFTKIDNSAQNDMKVFRDVVKKFFPTTWRTAKFDAYTALQIGRKMASTKDLSDFAYHAAYQEENVEEMQKALYTSMIAHDMHKDVANAALPALEKPQLDEQGYLIPAGQVVREIKANMIKNGMMKAFFSKEAAEDTEDNRKAGRNKLFRSWINESMQDAIAQEMGYKGDKPRAQLTVAELKEIYGTIGSMMHKLRYELQSQGLSMKQAWSKDQAWGIMMVIRSMNKSNLPTSAAILKALVEVNKADTDAQKRVAQQSLDEAMDKHRDWVDDVVVNDQSVQLIEQDLANRPDALVDKAPAYGGHGVLAWMKRKALRARNEALAWRDGKVGGIVRTINNIPALLNYIFDGDHKSRALQQTQALFKEMQTALVRESQITEAWVRKRMGDKTMERNIRQEFNIQGKARSLNEIMAIYLITRGDQSKLEADKLFEANPGLHQGDRRTFELMLQDVKRVVETNPKIKNLSKVFDDFFETVYKRINAVYKRINGRDLGKQHLYFPMLRHDGSFVANDWLGEALEIIPQKERHGRNPDARHEERSKATVGGRIMLDTLNVFNQYMSQADVYIAKAEYINKMKTIWGDHRLAGMFQTKFGHTKDLAAMQALIERERFATGRTEPLNDWELFIKMIRTNTVWSTLVINTPSVLRQMISTFNGDAEIPIANVWRVKAKLIKLTAMGIAKGNPLSKDRLNPFEGDYHYELMKKHNSPHIHARSSIDFGSLNAMRMRGLLSGLMVGGETLREFGMSPQRIVDQITRTSVWSAAFDFKFKQLRNSDISHETAESEAAGWADEVVDITQPAANVSQRNMMQTGNEFIRALTVFTGQPMKNLEHFRKDIATPLRRAWNSGYKDRGAMGAIQEMIGVSVGMGTFGVDIQEDYGLRTPVMQKFAFAMILPALALGALSRGRYPESWREFVTDVIAYNFSMVPIIGPAVLATVLYGNWANAGQTMYGDLIQSIGEAGATALDKLKGEDVDGAKVMGDMLKALKYVGFPNEVMRQFVNWKEGGFDTMEDAARSVFHIKEEDN